MTDKSAAGRTSQRADHAAMGDHIADHTALRCAKHGPGGFGALADRACAGSSERKKPAAKTAVAILFIATSLAAPPEEMRETRGAFR